MTTKPTKRYRLSGVQRLANWYFVHLTELGLGLRARHILSVRGRKSGVLHSNPVDVIDLEGYLWLVAPYGRSIRSRTCALREKPRCDVEGDARRTGLKRLTRVQVCP
jgi:hypothetical protein